MQTAPSHKRCLALFCLVAQSFLAFCLTNVQAQPVFVQPQSTWGGQQIHEMLPHQPEIVFVQPGQDQTPIYLDQLPEFCSLPENLEPQLPPGARSGLFQKIFVTGSWLPQLDNESLGVSDFETGITFGIPFFRVTTPLLITPRFAVHYLDGPNTPDLPARVYDAEVTFRHLRKFGNGPWAMNVAVTLGHYSDFEKSDADAFRVTGQALAVYESSPATQWIFGAAYINRKDLSVVPIVGVIHQPTPDIKYEAVLPRPRIAMRLPGDALGSNTQRWVYLAGEFGGGIWSIQRPTSLTQDLLTYNDYRVLLGIERKRTGGLSHHLEIGYVFGRELQFSSATPDVELNDSLFVRAGLTY